MTVAPETKLVTSLVLLSILLVSTVLIEPAYAALSYPRPGQITKGSGGASWNAWNDKEEAVPYFMSLADSYGGSYESIGKSSGNKGWDIVLFKFGNPNGGTIMIDAYLHGNEFYGYQVLKSVITWLVTSNDADARSILQNNYVLVVPVVNYRFGRTNYNIPSWMTANDPGNDGDDCGVDLDRNFAPSWPSSLSHSNSDSYSGASANSEAESQALITAWNTYQPRIYWNLHQGAGPMTLCTAKTSQAQEDANGVKSVLSSIQSELGISRGWSFSVSSRYGNGFSKDGAASTGSAGFLTEVMSGWDATASKKADLESGNTFKQVKAMFIAMCQTIEGSSSSPTPPLPTEKGNLNVRGYYNDEQVTCNVWYSGPEGSSSTEISYPPNGYTWQNLTTRVYYTIYGEYEGTQANTGVYTYENYTVQANLNFGGSSSPQYVWDLNRDGQVSIVDLAIFASAFMSTPEASHWNPQADVNSDGIVNLNDLVIVATHYGEKYSSINPTASIYTLIMPFDEDSPVTAADYSGYDNHGTITGAQATAEGILGGAYEFDGNDVITVQDDLTLDGGGAWSNITLDLWIKPMALLRGTRIIAKKAASASTGSYMIGFQTSTSDPPNTLFFGVAVNGNWEEVVLPGKTLAVETWHHVVCTYESGLGATIYVNGTEEANRPLTGTIDSGTGDEPLFLGYDGGGGSNRYFVGLLDEVKISPTVVRPNENATDENMQNMRTGVSYSSNDQHYIDATDAVLDRDFSIFRDNKIKLISLNVIWKSVEPETRGVYDSNTISNLKRVLAKAEEYGLSVLFSFHTHFQQQSNPYETPWHLPSYVVDPYTGKKITLAIVRSAKMKEAFLDYVQYVVSHVQSSPAIEAWSLLNEPMYWWDSGLPSGFSHKQSFQQLMAEGKALINSLDPRPVTVKFALPDSPWSGDFDLGTVMQIFDKIVALTAYIDPATGKDDWGMTLNDLNKAISDCSAYGRELWIAEFGKNTLNDESQSVFFRDAVSLYQLAGIKTLIAWTWIHDQTGMSNTDRGWSICADRGAPRPAFFELKSAGLE